MKAVLVYLFLMQFTAFLHLNGCTQYYTRTSFILNISLTKLWYAYMGTYLSFRRIMEPTSAGLEISNTPGKKLKIFFFIFLQLHFGFLFHWGTNNEVLGILFILVKKLQKSIKNCRNDSHEKDPYQVFVNRY